MSKSKLFPILLFSVFALLATASAKTLYVDINAVGLNNGTSWVAAYTNLQTAVSAAVSNDTVLVEDGTYGAITRTDKVPFLIKSLNGNANCIIDGKGVTRCCTFAARNELTAPTVEGFTIQNGYVTSGQGGGVMYGIYKNCIIQNCTHTHHDGGGGAGAASLYNCIIQNNTGMSGGGTYQCNVYDSIIRYNKAVGGSAGGAQYCDVYRTVIHNNTSTFQAGGLWNNYGHKAYSCVIYSNSAPRGGGVYMNDSNSSSISDSLIYANTATSSGGGGGVCMSGANDVINCTIVGNTAPSTYGSGVYSGDSLTHLYNSIVTDNYNSLGVLNNYGGILGTIRYSAFNETRAGTGNKAVNPLFRDATARDYRLSADSPCIDSGTNGIVSTSVDLAKSARIVNGTVDMGAYEYGLSPCVVTFDPQGGTPPAPTTTSVTCGSPYGTLATTTRTGFTFDGWWTATNGIEITSSTIASNALDHTLYAKWTADTTSGLVLWNQLGSTNEVQSSRVGPNGTLTSGTFVEGVFGSGIELKVPENKYGVCFPVDVVPATNGCIEFWAKMTGFPVSISSGSRPALLTTDPFGVPGQGGFQLFMTSNDGNANGGVCINSSLGWLGTGNFGIWNYARALGSDAVSAWHHYALVWSGTGKIPGVPDTNRQIVAYVDGKLNTSSGLNCPANSSLHFLASGRLCLLGPTATTGARVAYDNIKIWNYTKTDFSDRFEEGSSDTDEILFDLTVEGARGDANPANGVHAYAFDSNLSASAPGTVTAGALRYVCLDGTVTGNAFTLVNPTNITLTLTNNATLTWNWQAQYELTVDASGGGSVSGGGWYEEGSLVEIVATPASGYSFRSWSDDSTEETRSVTVPIGGLNLTASFDLIPCTTLPGLVLWNQLGSTNEVKTSRIGPNGTLTSGTFVEGVFGSGIELTVPENQYGVSFPVDVVPATNGCIEFWAKMTGFPASISSGSRPALLTTDPFGVPGQGGFQLFMTSNDGNANGGVCINSSLGWLGTGNFGIWNYARALGSDAVADWHHYALVWSGTGNIPGVADTSRQIVAYVDGKLNTGSGINCSANSTLHFLASGRLCLLGPTPVNGARVAYDNLKIWNYTKTDFSDRFEESTRIPVSLADAVDQTNEVYSTGDYSNWFGQTNVTHDGIDAAQSGDVTDGQQCWMQTAVTGPGMFSFRWKVSSQANSDYLRFYIDDVEQSVISGEVDWQQRTYTLSSGNHTIKWSYTKDASVSSGSDCGWVDQVIWASGAGTNFLPVYRFWSPVFSGHFFTMNETEKNNIINRLSAYWTYEGVAYYAYPEQVAGTIPVYRFWSPVFSGHFYTTNETEKNNIINQLSAYWTYEGVAWYAYSTQVAGTVPVYRFWSPVFAHHFFTINEVEKNNIICGLSAYWTYEGIAYYAFASLGLDTLLGDSALASIAIPEGTDDVSSVALQGVANCSSVAGEADISEVQCNDSSDLGEVIFPLSYPGGRQVTAYVYDSLEDRWTNVLGRVSSPVLASFADAQAGRSYRFEVWVDNLETGELVLDHTSWFEHQLDAPAQLNGDAEVLPSELERNVGSPIVRIKMPQVEGTISLKLYSATDGVIQTIEGVVGEEAIELGLPKWNQWYWINGCRDSDNESVVSLWIRHGTETETVEP